MSNFPSLLTSANATVSAAPPSIATFLNGTSAGRVTLHSVKTQTQAKRNRSLSVMLPVPHRLYCRRSLPVVARLAWCWLAWGRAGGSVDFGQLFAHNSGVFRVGRQFQIGAEG